MIGIINSINPKETGVSKTTRKRKHIPQRTCVGCRQVLPKRSLIRIVRSPEGILVDPTGKLPGRGAYLHDKRSCWELGIKNALSHALRTTITEEDSERLTAFMDSLPEELHVAEINNDELV